MKLTRSLLFRVVVAIAIGLVCGLFVGESVVRTTLTFNVIFSSLLNFSIPLIIFGLVTPAIASLGKGVGRLLTLTVAIAYGSTLFSGFFTYSVSTLTFPMVIPDDLIDVGKTLSQNESLKPFFTFDAQPIFSVTSSLLFAFILGIGGSALGEQSVLRRLFDDFKLIIENLIVKAIVPLLPIHIFGLFIHMSYTGEAKPILMLFTKVIIIIFILHIVLLLLQFTIAGAITKRNPLKALKTMLPAYATALGTQSSAATIPVTLAQTKKNGVRSEIAEFVIPLCATIHLSGSMMKIVACAIALMMITAHPFNLGLMTEFICTLGVVMIAAPGVPGGAIMAAVGVLQSVLGFTADQQTLMIALYIAMDSFGTACNVTGDGSIALLADALHKKS